MEGEATMDYEGQTDRAKDKMRMRTKGRRGGKAKYIHTQLFYKYGTSEVLNCIRHYKKAE